MFPNGVTTLLAAQFSAAPLGQAPVRRLRKASCCDRFEYHAHPERKRGGGAVAFLQLFCRSLSGHGNAH